MHNRLAIGGRINLEGFLTGCPGIEHGIYCSPSRRLNHYSNPPIWVELKDLDSHTFVPHLRTNIDNLFISVGVLTNTLGRVGLWEYNGDVNGQYKIILIGRNWIGF